MDLERELKPVFVEKLFLFENNLAIPDHYNESPTVPNFLGQWALFGWIGGSKTLNCAVDILSEEQAVLLATAKKDRMEDNLARFGHTLDIYIFDPSGKQTRFYAGLHSEQE